MTSTLGIKKIQYPNGTNSITIDSSGSADITTANITTATITTANVTTAAITTANVTNATATGTITTPSINGSQIGGRRNLIINGAMAVNQRGATSGVTSGYFVDRFRLSGCSASAVITSNTPTEFPTAITVSATSGNPIVSQRVESKNVQHLSGKTVTASFLAKNVSNATTLYVSLAYAGSADSWGSSTTISEQNLGTLTGNWVKYTASWTVPAGGLNGLGLNILCAGSSTFTMGVAGVQLEVGSQATEFEHVPFAEELSLCQRYFYSIDEASSSTPVHLIGYNQAGGACRYGVHNQMRAHPTVTSSNMQIFHGTGGTVNITSIDSQRSQGGLTGFRANPASAISAGDAVAFYTNGTNAYIRLDAEL